MEKKMFSVATKTVVTFDTDSLYSTLRRFIGEKYLILKNKSEKYMDITIQVDINEVPSDKVQLLYNYLKDLYPPTLDTHDILGTLEDKFGIHQAHRYKIATEDELGTLNAIRNLLGAKPKYDNDFVRVFMSVHKNCQTICIQVKCDEWIDF